jgi:hypothetical protein
VQSRLQSVEFGEPQIYETIVIVPLITRGDGKFQYCTLGESLAAWDIAISEVSIAGSIQELMVVNHTTKPIMMIGGEELAGAKQNRALNTSILIKEDSKIAIPVSSTEQGRWSYTSKAFSESGLVIDCRTRSQKTRSVHNFLEARGAPLADQREIWHGIAELQAKAGAASPTSAMSGVYRAREGDLRKCDEIFKAVPNQVGLLAIINGRPAGADLVSLAAAYAKLHSKLVRSYALEGLLDSNAKPATPDSTIPGAQAFLAAILAAEECQFRSVGYGNDHRFKGKALAGAALVHKNEVIHAAFFRLDEQHNPGKLASLSNRRRSTGQPGDWSNQGQRDLITQTRPRRPKRHE